MFCTNTEMYPSQSELYATVYRSHRVKICMRISDSKALPLILGVKLMNFGHDDHAMRFTSHERVVTYF